MNRLGPLLMQRLDQLLEFVDFNSTLELDYLQIAQCLEGMRQRCCQLDHDLQRVQEHLRQSESERLVLEVKLKHARNQVEVEMKKRHGAEAELEKQERKLKLIYDCLMADPQISSLSEDQCLAALAVFNRPCFSHSTLLPSKHCVPGEVLPAVKELGTSILSDISFDHSDDEIDLGTTRPIKDRDRGRSSLAPLIQPVVAAKRARPSAAAISSSSQSKGGMRVVTLKSGVIADNKSSVGHSLIPIAATSRRCSQPNRWPSTKSDLTTIWGSTDSSTGGGSQAENDNLDIEIGHKQRGAPVPFTPSPPQSTPTLQQHHFTSKTVIRLEYCAVCKSRLRFGKIAFRCRPCQLLVHPECKEHCQALCTPSAHPRVREGILADFAPATPPLVPPIVIQCVNQVEKRGLQETGLYRVPGAEHLVHEWKNKLLSARRALPSLDHVADVNVICGILKDFLRSLKEPLVTFCLHSAFLHAAEIPDESARHTALCHVVMKLPLANRDTLAFLMLHLHRVIKSPECRMDQHNLARIFGPTLVGHSTPNPTPVIIMEDTPRQCLVVSHLLALPLKFWKRFVGEEQENLVPSVQQTNGVNEQEQLSCPLSSPKINAPIQMSPGSGCLPSKLCDCIGTTFPPLNGHRTKKTGKILALPK
ncbi:rac GTPase-activating protein 1-like isoform X2 [Sceloporus undulatus]|nr:rac GTPase-activating protein 1-like isoform X2 [Sceloporus undulatus]